MSIANNTILKGRAVSRGVAIGTAVCLYGDRFQFYQHKIPASEREIEIKKFQNAISVSRETIERAISAQDEKGRAVAVEILRAHRSIIDDPALSERVIELINSDGLNVEFAVEKVFDEFTSRMSEIDGVNGNEKALDVNDVRHRIFSALGLGFATFQLPANSIVVAKEISPSRLLELIENGVIGIAAESGGWTSHTSILARESHIPAVTGISDIFKLVQNGRTVVVDGFKGELIVDPRPEEVRSYATANTDLNKIGSQSPISIAELTTLDGRKITIRTNTVSLDTYNKAAVYGAKGIGLFRSESLIAKFNRVPTEEEQTEQYRKFANAVGGHGLRVRTFDIEASQSANFSSAFQKNPALGLRAIRLGLEDPDLLSTQIRALLRAAHERDVGIVVPMVTGCDEIQEVRQIIDAEIEDLESSGINIGAPKLGAMIEVPSAVLVADQLASSCDFLCLGTNDLAQYMLAADRDNEAVSKWFRTLHPAMIRAVRHVIDECRKAERQLIICGEMASSPFYVPILIGLVADELSINPATIEAVSRMVAGIAYTEAVELVNDISKLDTAEQIDKMVEARSKELWHHLFPPGFFEMHNS